MGHPSSTAPRSGFGTSTAVAGGIAAIAAGACWTVKAVAILLTGRQPPLLFELAPLLMAIAALALGQQLPATRHRVVSTGAATAALVAALVVLTNYVMPVTDLAYALAMGGAHIFVLVGLVAAGHHLRRRLEANLPLALGIVTIPAMLTGGLASIVAGERALEVPLMALGMTWMALGRFLAQGRYSSP